MHLLSISKSTGGVAIYNAQLCKHLNRFDEFDVHVICLSENNENYADELRGEGVPATCMEMDRYAINVVGDLRLVGQLWRFVKEGDYDVIIGHGAKGGFLARLIGRLAGVKSVYVLHSLPFLTRVQGRRAYLYRLLEQGVSRLGGEIIAITHSQREALITHHITKGDRISVIHTGIDTAQLNTLINRKHACETLGLDPERLVVGWVGRMMRQKAPLDFMHVAEQIVSAIPNVQILIAGDGMMKDDILRFIAKRNLQDNTLLLPWQSDVALLFSAMDVFMMTSHWEGLPLSLLEAMGVGTATVATAVDGIPEVIRHGKEGYLAQAGDIEMMTKHAMTLLEDAQHRAQIQQAAQARIFDQFTFEQMIDRWCTYLQGVV